MILLGMYAFDSTPKVLFFRNFVPILGAPLIFFFSSDTASFHFDLLLFAIATSLSFVSSWIPRLV